LTEIEGVVAEGGIGEQVEVGIVLEVEVRQFLFRGDLVEIADIAREVRDVRGAATVVCHCEEEEEEEDAAAMLSWYMRMYVRLLIDELNGRGVTRKALLCWLAHAQPIAQGLPIRKMKGSGQRWWQTLAVEVILAVLYDVDVDTVPQINGRRWE